MEELNELMEQSLYMLSLTKTNFVRYVHDVIDWEDRLIGIKGARDILL